MFIQRPTPETLDRVTQKVKQWLTSHNLPLWAIPVAWAFICLPSIAVAWFKLPLAIVLLMSSGGFIGLSWVVYFRNNSSGDYSEKGVEFTCDPEVELTNRDDPQVHTHNLSDQFQAAHQIPQPQFASDEQEQTVDGDLSAEATDDLSQAQALASAILANVATCIRLKDWPVNEAEQSAEIVADGDRSSKAVQESDEVEFGSGSDSEVEEIGEESELEAQDVSFYNELVAEREHDIEEECDRTEKLVSHADSVSEAEDSNC
jgi:hypothetical protein